LIKSKMQHIMKCPKCAKYTLSDKCPKCGVATVKPRPAKFPVDDKFGSYRRKAKGMKN